MSHALEDPRDLAHQAEVDREADRAEHDAWRADECRCDACQRERDSIPPETLREAAK